jgi:adenylosuccinate synthase
MTCTVVVGGFYGDEGKGHIVSYLAVKDKPPITVRGGVGPNAGHKVVFQGRTYGLRMVPCGFVNPNSRLLIGPGVLVNPKVLLEEIKLTETENRIGIDKQCAIIEERHIEEEKKDTHLTTKIGTTKTGVGICQAERAHRKAKLAKEIPEISRYITDVPLEVNTAISRKEAVLVEGTQGTYISLYHGTYPFCTTKDVCASAICSDVGIGPTAVDDVVVVFKAFVTRVGEGPLENQLPTEELERRGWLEFGTVTSRPRRAAPFDFKLAKRAVMLNGATQAAVTKLDVVYTDCKGVRNFEKLSEAAKKFTREIESETGIPVTLIGTGPSVEETIDRRRP